MRLTIAAAAAIAGLSASMAHAATVTSTCSLGGYAIAGPVTCDLFPSFDSNLGTLRSVTVKGDLKASGFLGIIDYRSDPTVPAEVSGHVLVDGGIWMMSEWVPFSFDANHFEGFDVVEALGGANPVPPTPNPSYRWYWERQLSAQTKYTDPSALLAFGGTVPTPYIGAGGPYAETRLTGFDGPVDDISETKYGYDVTIIFDYFPTSAVPEPANWAMMILGFGATGSLLRRQRKTALTA